jgi:hypothetical protein
MKRPTYPRLNPRGLPIAHLTRAHVLEWLRKLYARRLAWHLDDDAHTVGNYNAARDAWVPLFTPAQARMAERDRLTMWAVADGQHGPLNAPTFDPHRLSLVVLYLQARARRPKGPARLWRCPDWESEPGAPVGCGRLFRQSPDDEGWLDCPHCGLAFHHVTGYASSGE